MAEEKGPFLLFALFLKEDATDVWDFLVAAPWITEDKSGSLRYIASKTQEVLEPDELLKLSRIVLIDEANPALEAIQRTIRIEEHGVAESQNSNFFGLQIKHAYLITSKRKDDSSPNKPLQPMP